MRVSRMRTVRRGRANTTVVTYVARVMSSMASMASVTRMTGIMATVTMSVLPNPTECHGDESNAAHGKRGQVYVHS